ncbi:hypothetical protein BC936DRAFT_139394, partial [Jimgerdemannia flammicorona]
PWLANRDFDFDDSQDTQFSQPHVPNISDRLFDFQSPLNRLAAQGNGETKQQHGNAGKMVAEEKENDNPTLAGSDDCDMARSSSFQGNSGSGGSGGGGENGIRKPLSPMKDNSSISSSTSSVGEKDGAGKTLESQVAPNSYQTPNSTPPVHPNPSRYLYTYLSRPTIFPHPASTATTITKPLTSDPLTPTSTSTSTPTLDLRRLSLHIGDVERVLEGFAARAGTCSESLGRAVNGLEEARERVAKETETMRVLCEEGRVERAVEGAASKILVPTLVTLCDTLLTAISDGQETGWARTQSALRDVQARRTEEDRQQRAADEAAQAEVASRVQVVAREVEAQRKMLEKVVEVGAGRDRWADGQG